MSDQPQTERKAVYCPLPKYQSLHDTCGDWCAWYHPHFNTCGFMHFFERLSLDVALIERHLAGEKL